MRSKLWPNLIFLLVAAWLVYAMVRYTYPVRLRPGITHPLPSNPPVEVGQSGMPPCWFSEPTLSEGQAAVQSVVADCLVLIPGQDKLNVFEVNLYTGLFVHVSTDVYLPARPAIAFTRVSRAYSNWAKKWSVFLPHLYDIFQFGDRHPYTYAELVPPDGIRYRFERISLGTGYRDALHRHETTRTVLYGSEIRWNGNGWDVRRLGNGFQLAWPDMYRIKRPQKATPIALRDSSGNQLQLLRDPEGNLLRVVSEDGEWLELRREGDYIAGISDSRGGSARYSYDSFDRLRSVVLPDGATLSYRYDDSNRITEVHKDDRLLLRNKYDEEGRVAKQTFADGQRYCFNYSLDSRGNPEETTIIDARGRAVTVRFHGREYEISESATPSRCK